MIGTFFKLVGKALRFTISRPLQRFNIESRAKKHLGEDAKYFMPAPRAIGAISRDGPSQYPHLEGGVFKSIRRKRLEALQKRQEQLKIESPNEPNSKSKSFSETETDDNLIIDASSKLPVIKTIAGLENPPTTSQIAVSDTEGEPTKRSHRPLPKLTNLPLQDPANIWAVDKTPIGRLNLNQLQELMINVLADDKYWTPEKISETYAIKKEYAENLLKYLRQIRIVISPRIKYLLDYTARNDPVYQATKDVIYYVDKSLRSEFDRRYDKMYLPTDELDEEVRELIDAGALKPQQVDPYDVSLFKRPKPLKVSSKNKSESSQQLETGKMRKRLTALNEPKRISDDKDR